MYTSSVRDSQAFFRKVFMGRDKLKKFIASQLDEPLRMLPGTPLPPEERHGSQGKTEGEEGEAESDIEIFCRCKGNFNSVTGYFVACDAD